MDNMYYNNFNYGNGMMGMGYPGQSYQYAAPMAVPQNSNALTEEEMAIIAKSAPQKLDININEVDNFRAMCTHKRNGRDMVVRCNDDSGDVFCPICGARWHPEQLTKEQVTEIVNQLISQMQNSKWVGDLNTALVRDYYPMIPLLEKFPEIYDYAMKTFNRYLNQNGYTDANDTSVYAQYNSLMGYGNTNPYMTPQYGMPTMNAPQGYYGQTTNQYGVGANTQAPQGYYGQAPQYGMPAMNAPQGYYGQTQVTPSNVNPMQIQYGAPMNPQMMAAPTAAPQQATYAPANAVNQNTPAEDASATTPTATSDNVVNL